ncbi:MAG: succinate dehydrogenase cytochrome b subunit [Planctomycetota bacterium]
MIDWLARLLRSSIGRKTGMALSGLLLTGFVITHLLGNLTLLKSNEAFNAYAQKLEDMGPLLTVAELGLLGLFVFHIVLALLVSLRSKGARSQGYRVSASAGQKTLGSSTMRITGILVLLFLAVHIWDFRFQKLIGAEGAHDLGALVHARLTSPVGMGIYILSAILLGLHLSHGFKSAFQTLGLRHNKFNGTIAFVGVALSIALALGFALIPVALSLGMGGSN